MKRTASKGGEVFYLLGFNLVVQWRRLIEFIRVVRRYYLKHSFYRIDLHLAGRYFLNSPYAISKRFLKQQGADDIYTYGETPLTTLEQIASRAKLSSNDLVFDLGCGPGRTSFWLRTFIGCEVIGIEQIPTFVWRAQVIQQVCQLDKIEFRLQDMHETDYTGATAIYLYGTCFDEVFLAPLIERFRALERGTKIITVSYSLNEMTSNPCFEIIECFPARYTWGEANVYLQIV